MTTLGGLGTAAAPLDRYPGLLHQTTYLEATHCIHLVLEVFGQATTAIAVMRLFEDRLHTLKQGNLVEAERWCSLTFEVVIQPAAPDPQHLTQNRYRPGLLVLRNESVFQLDSLAKKTVAFFTISRSMRRRWFSLRNRRSSSCSADL
jgi:hypothetical protein